MQALQNFQCRTYCKHKLCQRHANLGVVNRNLECECVHQELTGSSIFLENVIDISHTLSQIMVLCGIQECKAKTAVDIITYSFLHYDLVCYRLEDKPLKRLRKEDVFHELGRKCLMNRVEAHLCYTIIKRGFKAFYYKSEVEKLNGKSSYSKECVYVHAAKKTAESFAQFDGLSSDEKRVVETKIKVAYKKFYDRMQSRNSKLAHDNCNCCFCIKKRDYLVYSTAPTYFEPTHAKTLTCPCCDKISRGKKFSTPIIDKCPKCCRFHNCCSCAKYEFDIDWVKSIWYRPDMNLYYQENIEKKPQESVTECNLQDLLPNSKSVREVEILESDKYSEKDHLEIAKEVVNEIINDLKEL